MTPIVQTRGVEDAYNASYDTVKLAVHGFSEGAKSWSSEFRHRPEEMHGLMD
jgi:hypothetical protein